MPRGSRAPGILTTDLATAAPTGPLMTPEEVGAYLRMSPGQLANWRYEGGGPPYRKLGRAIRYDRQEMLAWLENHRRTGTATG